MQKNQYKKHSLFAVQASTAAFYFLVNKINSAKAVMFI
jgi:hypothetical protein